MAIKTIVVAVTAAFFLLTGSCDTGNSNNPANPTEQTGAKAYGVFLLKNDQSGNTTSFTGKLYNGPYPTFVSDTVMTSGECRLIKRKDRSCIECNGICVDNNNCQPEPDNITVGTVTVTGLINKSGTTKGTMSLTANGVYQLIKDNASTNPPSTEDGTITLTASGNDSVAGFTLSAKAISPIEVDADTIEMNPGEDIHLTWNAADNPDDSRITVVIDIAYHGGKKGKIECDCADDGDLVIPGEMLDSLKAIELAGHPKLEIYRTSLGTDKNTGVQLRIEAYTLVWLKIPGLISCNGDSNSCPEGMECVNERCVEVE